MGEVKGMEQGDGHRSAVQNQGLVLDNVSEVLRGGVAQQFALKSAGWVAAPPRGGVKDHFLVGGDGLIAVPQKVPVQEIIVLMDDQKLTFRLIGQNFEVGERPNVSRMTEVFS